MIIESRFDGLEVFLSLSWIETNFFSINDLLVFIIIKSWFIICKKLHENDLLVGDVIVDDLSEYFLDEFVDNFDVFMVEMVLLRLWVIFCVRLVSKNDRFAVFN